MRECTAGQYAATSLLGVVVGGNRLTNTKSDGKFKSVSAVFPQKFSVFVRSCQQFEVGVAKAKNRDVTYWGAQIRI